MYESPTINQVGFGGRDANQRQQASHGVASSSSDIVSRNPQVPISRYFLLMEIKGFLLAEWFGLSGPLKDNLGLTKREELHVRVRPGFADFMRWCLSNFEVVFWSSEKDQDMDTHFQHLRNVVPELGSDHLRFGRSFCDLSKFTDAGSTQSHVHWLKRLERLLRNRYCLGLTEASLSNTLIIDNVPFRSVLNDPYNSIHPRGFKYKSERNKNQASYLLKYVKPFLQELQQSGNRVSAFCAKHDNVHTFVERLMPWDDHYEQLRLVHPSWASGFEIPADPSQIDTRVPLRL
jgi:NLI interacting factor-like phosphatase